MTFLEKDLEQIIFETDHDDLYDSGLPVYGKVKRQLRIGNYGVADLVTFSREGQDVLRITIYELKQNEVGVSTFGQAIRYAKGISQYILNHRKKNLSLHFEFILVGKSFQKGDFIYMTDFIPNLRVFTYEYEFDGIYFNECYNYSLIHSGFND
jgi:hypothetical protein